MGCQPWAVVGQPLVEPSRLERPWRPNGGMIAAGQRVAGTPWMEWTFGLWGQSPWAPLDEWSVGASLEGGGPWVSMEQSRGKETFDLGTHVNLSLSMHPSRGPFEGLCESRLSSPWLRMPRFRGNRPTQWTDCLGWTASGATPSWCRQRTLRSVQSPFRCRCGVSVRHESGNGSVCCWGKGGSWMTTCRTTDGADVVPWRHGAWPRRVKGEPSFRARWVMVTRPACGLRCPKVDDGWARLVHAPSKRHRVGLVS